jgi:tetraacyldisaccharide 4'-kinase
MLNYLYDLATDRRKGVITFFIKLFLLVLSYLYGLFIIILRFFSSLKPINLSCKVISVGNITLGGTGKTVIVEHIACYLKEKGQRVAILSRGYRRKPLVASHQSLVNYETMGDEPYMLQLALKDIPVIVNSDRIKAAKQAIEKHNVDTVILDDGFQQWKIKKDLEIVAVDSNFAFGNKKMLPRGLLREPLSSLGRADVFLLTKTNLGIKDEALNLLMRINKKALIIKSEHEPLSIYNIKNPEETYRLEFLKDKKLASLSAIADPESFEKIISSFTSGLCLSFVFPDHYEYRKQDLERIDNEAQDKGLGGILTTQKDAVKLGPEITGNLKTPLYVLRIRLKISENEQGLYQRLLRVYGN